MKKPLVSTCEKPLPRQRAPTSLILPPDARAVRKRALPVSASREHLLLSISDRKARVVFRDQEMDFGGLAGLWREKDFSAFAKTGCSKSKSKPKRMGSLRADLYEWMVLTALPWEVNKNLKKESIKSTVTASGEVERTNSTQFAQID